MAIPKIDIFFSGTNAEAGALTGWVRDTAFDGKYILGCSSSDTTGGGTGGQTTHNHTTTAHLHSLGTLTSPESNNDTNGLTTIASAGHGHASVNLSSVTATVGTANNQPPYYKLIVIKSLGTSLNLPAKGVVISDQAQFDPSPFSANLVPADGTGGIPDLISNTKYFPLGADASGDSGGTGGSTTHYHNFAHSHTTPVTSGTSTNSLNLASTRGSGIIGSHTHSVTISNSLTPGAYDSQAVDGNPPNIIAVPYYVNTDTPLETGMIGMWTGAKSAIPDHWTEVTAYRDYFVRFNGGTSSFFEDEEGNFFYSYDDVGSTGGSDQHTHTSAHSHIGTTAGVTGSQYLSQSSTKVSAYTHTHTWVVGSSDANFANNTSKSNYPPYIKVFFIKYTAPIITPGAYYNSTFYNSTLYKN